MALIHSFEKTGYRLFRYRGQIPVVLFACTVPVIWFTDYSFLTPNRYYLLTICSVVVCMLGMWVRAYTIATTPKGTSGRNTKKQVAESLNQTGIYSLIRHPLYLGNFLMWIGIAAFTFNVWFVVIVALLFWIYYERIMFAEERFLEKKFGQEFLDWSMKVPAFFPMFKNYKKNKVDFSIISVLRREYSGFLAAVSGFVFVDVVRKFMFVPDYDFFASTAFYIQLVAFCIALIFRTLKHHTSILNETDRS
jgi:protein-S-isoprenylcysteine O-methyltransferase Ste14